MSRLAGSVALLVLFALGASEAPPGVGGDTRNRNEDGASVELTAAQAAAQGAPAKSGPGSSTRWVRHAICSDWGRTQGWAIQPGVWDDDQIPDCTTLNPPIIPTVTCRGTEVPLDPWWSSRLESDGTYGPWTLASSYQCATDLLLAAVEREWSRMPIAASTYQMQPAAGYAIADLGVNLVVDSNPRTMNATLLGTPVTIRAVPTQFVWSGSDGTTWTAASRGKPVDQGGTPFTFPAGDEHRTSFTLTTTWRGEFTTNGGTTWRDAPGNATTTSAPTSIHVYSPHTHLVDCDLGGTCSEGSNGGGNQKTILDPDGDGIDNYLIPDHQIADYLATRDAGRVWTSTERKG